MHITAIQQLIATAHDPQWHSPEHFARRIDLLDRLEDALLSQPESSELHAAVATLEHANRVLYRRLRESIVQGREREALLPWAEPANDNVPTYDYRDALLSGVLELPEPGDNIGALEPEMVHYQPTPARRIFDLLDLCRLQANDVLVDLGAGLGHVPLLTAICTNARSIGIERERTYVHSARQAATALKLERADFVCQDLRDSDLAAGTVFYLYTPVTGSLLHDLLGRLEAEAKQRPIRICSLGPCTHVLAQMPWLRAAHPPHEHRIGLFIASESTIPSPSR